MMETADLRDGDHFPGATCLYRPLLRAVLSEREMGSRSVVVIDVRRKYAAQMPLVEDDHVVQTLSADRAETRST